MATDLIGDATFDVYEIALIVSEDSDFVPAVDFVQEMRNKHVVHVGFGGYMNELRTNAGIASIWPRPAIPPGAEAAQRAETAEPSRAMAATPTAASRMAPATNRSRRQLRGSRQGENGRHCHLT